MAAIESIVEGTWGDGQQPPAEFIDYFLMKQMGWSWEALQETPVYVRRFCYDAEQAVLSHEAEQAEKSRSDAEAEARRR